MSNSPTPPGRPPQPGKFLADFFNSILNSGADRAIPHAFLIAITLGAIWLTRSNVLAQIPTVIDLGNITGKPTAVPVLESPVAAPIVAAAPPADLVRQTDPHTNIPTRPRKDIITYTVATGDTLFGIAEKFGVSPETIVWGNPILKDTPDLLRPGQVFRIAPVSGVLRDVQPNDRLDVLANYYKVTVDDIVNWPGNNLDPANPQLVVGQSLVIPGGTREFVQFVVPHTSRAVKRVVTAGSDPGPGACPGGYTGGAIGSGFFIWPANNHWLSGNDYWAGHLGIDIAAGVGDAVFASDSGVVVFAGWSNWGYGNMVQIDHGNGWNTLYAHLSQYNVSCGQSVLQGNIIGLAGNTGNSTGPHLHFEMNFQGSRPNPHNYLPAP